jgi:hypothetical protein
MTDARLAEMLVSVQAIERDVRAAHGAARDKSEQDAALVAVRQVVALRKPLEKWIAVRACRAAQ